MISFEEVGTMLNDIALNLPEDIYIYLNGGINLLPDTKLHAESRNNDLFILGEYHHEKYLGRYINVYYGSFIRVYGHLSHEQQCEKLRGILGHEFVHHLESMAGERDLEIKDAWEIARYKQR